MTGRGRFVGYAVAFALAVGVVAGPTAAADDSSTETSIEAAIDQTDLAIEAQKLAGREFVLVGGSLALGLGIGIVVASGVTYAYKSREFTRRLE